jgi:DNA-binding IclR family transcriptional regulator
MTNSDRYHIKSIIQAGDILKAVANSKEPVSAADLAKSLGFTQNTAFRICTTLADIGFLTQVGEKYELGMALMLFWAKKKAMLTSQRELIDQQLMAIDIKGVNDGDKTSN